MSTHADRAPEGNNAGTIPLCVPFLGGKEWEYVRECLDTNFVSSVGPFVERFERMLAAEVGTQHAVATMNGTAAIHVALLIADVKPDDEVLVSTLTFIAPVNAIRYVGAWPVLCDAEPTYWQMDTKRVVRFLENGCTWDGTELRNKETGRRVSAILPVHILGHPVDMDPLLEVARRFDLPVIEDATESLGARYKGRKVGALGDVGCFSFNGNKLITTGGGGMIVTSRSDWARRAKQLTTQAKSDPLEYIHDEIGYNYRLTNILAALGCAQLEQLDEFLAAKRAIARRYSEALEKIEGVTPLNEAPWAKSAFWMYTVAVDERRSGLTSRELRRALSESGIETRPLWQPIHRSPAHAWTTATEAPVADLIYQQALSLPCSIGLSLPAQRTVIERIAELASSASQRPS